MQYVTMENLMFFWYRSLKKLMRLAKEPARSLRRKRETKKILIRSSWDKSKWEWKKLWDANRTSWTKIRETIKWSNQKIWRKLRLSWQLMILSKKRWWLSKEIWSRKHLKKPRHVRERISSRLRRCKLLNSVTWISKTDRDALRCNWRRN